jgi:hypothetical protein
MKHPLQPKEYETTYCYSKLTSFKHQYTYFGPTEYSPGEKVWVLKCECENLCTHQYVGTSYSLQEFYELFSLTPVPFTLFNDII